MGLFRNQKAISYFREIEQEGRRPYRTCTTTSRSKNIPHHDHDNHGDPHSAPIRDKSIAIASGPTPYTGDLDQPHDDDDDYDDVEAFDDSADSTEDSTASNFSSWDSDRSLLHVLPATPPSPVQQLQGQDDQAPGRGRNNFRTKYFTKLGMFHPKKKQEELKPSSTPPPHRSSATISSRSSSSSSITRMNSEVLKTDGGRRDVSLSLDSPPITPSSPWKKTKKTVISFKPQVQVCAIPRRQDLSPSSSLWMSSMVPDFMSSMERQLYEQEMAANEDPDSYCQYHDNGNDGWQEDDNLVLVLQEKRQQHFLYANGGEWFQPPPLVREASFSSSLSSSSTCSDERNGSGGGKSSSRMERLPVSPSALNLKRPFLMFMSAQQQR